MGDVPRILNMYVLISFVVSRLSFVLVTDLMRKKRKGEKKLQCSIVCVGLISDHLNLTCEFPRQLSVSQLLKQSKLQTENVLFCMCYKS